MFAGMAALGQGTMKVAGRPRRWFGPPHSQHRLRLCFVLVDMYLMGPRDTERAQNIPSNANNYPSGWVSPGETGIPVKTSPSKSLLLP